MHSFIWWQVAVNNDEAISSSNRTRLIDISAHSCPKVVESRDVNSLEISFSGLKAQILGLIRVSIWTTVIKLAKQRQRVRPGSVACLPRRIRRPHHRCHVSRKKAAATIPAAAASAPSQVSGSPRGTRPSSRRDVVGVVSQSRCVDCCRVLELHMAPASTTRHWRPSNGHCCVGGRRTMCRLLSIVNNDASSVLQAGCSLLHLHCPAGRPL